MVHIVSCTALSVKGRHLHLCTESQLKLNYTVRRVLERDVSKQMSVNNSIKRQNDKKQNQNERWRRIEKVVGEASHSNMALEKLVFMLGLICKSILNSVKRVGYFDSWVDRQTSFFLCGENEGDRKKNTHSFFDTECGNKHDTSQTVHGRLSDEKLQRPENTKQDKAENKEKLLEKQWEGQRIGERGTIWFVCYYHLNHQLFRWSSKL